MFCSLDMIHEMFFAKMHFYQSSYFAFYYEHFENPTFSPLSSYMFSLLGYYLPPGQTNYPNLHQYINKHLLSK